MPKQLYDIAKWAALVAMPALVVLIATVGPVWDVPRSDDIAITVAAISAFVGALVGVSSAAHTASTKEPGRYADLDRTIDGD